MDSNVGFLVKKKKNPVCVRHGYLCNIMHLSFASPWADPRATHGQPTGAQGEWHNFGISFFPTGEESCLVLETTFLDQGDIPTGFVRGSTPGEVNNRFKEPV